jgi:hypothetical protein
MKRLVRVRHGQLPAQEDGRIIFDFGADGTGQHSAAGTLSQRSWRFSFEMRVDADFENNVYQRTERLRSFRDGLTPVPISIILSSEQRT